MRSILRLLPYLRQSRRLLLAVLILSVLSQAALLLTPKVIQKIIENALEKTPEDIAPWAMLILGLAIIKGGLSAGETLIGTRLGQRVLLNLRQDIYAHLCRLKLRFFDGVRSGELLSRVTADLEPIDTFFSWGARLIFRSVLLFTGVLIFCFNMNAKLTLVSLSIVPLISITAFVIGMYIRPTWQTAREKVGDFTSALEETLSGIRVVKMCTQEQNETAKLTRSSEAVREKTWRSNRIDAAYHPITNLWAGLAGLMVLAYGGSLIITGELTIPEYIAFEVYLILLWVPMRMMGWMVSGLQRAAVGAQRIFALLDEEPEPGIDIRGQEGEAAGSSPAVDIEGRVAFEDVAFGYRADEPVLRSLNLEVQPGEIVGILGPTGSGKSALVALISRLYDPTQGRVLIDGKDLKDYNLRQLRRKIGMVFQEPFLFSGTIRENITFGRPEASEEEIEAAAKKAALHDFIVGLEKGYETIIGERGLNLSGGQQQRLALARTLLIDPRILILDDCTSSVDAHTEFLIQQALQELMVGRTTFIISQRAASVSIADKIIVLDEGEITEQGSPEELAAITGGHYRRLLEVQKSLGVEKH